MRTIWKTKGHAIYDETKSWVWVGKLISSIGIQWWIELYNDGLNSILAEILRKEMRLSAEATLEDANNTTMAWITHINKSKNFSKVQCFECKEYGHTISHCKEEKFYTYCKKNGHIIAECK